MEERDLRGLKKEYQHLLGLTVELDKILFIIGLAQAVCGSGWTCWVTGSKDTRAIDLILTVNGLLLRLFAWTRGQPPNCRMPSGFEDQAFCVM